MADSCFTQIIVCCTHELLQEGEEDILFSHDLWVALCSGNACAGAVPFRANLKRIHCVGTFPNGNGHYKDTGREHIPTLRQLPFGGDVDYGMIDHLTYWDLAGHLLDLGAGPDVRVRCVKHNVRLELGDEYEVLGADETVGVCTVYPPGSGNGPEDAAADGAGQPFETDWDSGLKPKTKTRPNARGRR